VGDGREGRMSTVLDWKKVYIVRSLLLKS
jgi:hypothetical protein